MCAAIFVVLDGMVQIRNVVEKLPWLWRDLPESFTAIVPVERVVRSVLWERHSRDDTAPLRGKAEVYWRLVVERLVGRIEIVYPYGKYILSSHDHVQQIEREETPMAIRVETLHIFRAQRDPGSKTIALCIRGRSTRTKLAKDEQSGR